MSPRNRSRSTYPAPVPWTPDTVPVEEYCQKSQPTEGSLLPQRAIHRAYNRFSVFRYDWATDWLV